MKHRQYDLLNEELGKVSIDDLELVVPNHPFWRKFADGWEPDTERIFRSLLGPGSVVLDIGAWIGPTIIFALSTGASKIIALEPNPNSYRRLKKIIELNPSITERVTLVNRALHTTPGKLKMGLATGETDTSMFGIAGSEYEVDTISLGALLQEHQLENIDLVKIDIEGAEAFLHEELEQLSQQTGQAVHLSVHVPFFPEEIDKNQFADSFSNYKIYDDRGEKLSTQLLRHRLLSKESHPQWGTQHGNFFELLLVGRG